MSRQLTDVTRRWTELGAADPMWAALTESGRGGAWDVDEFLRTGRSEIDGLLALLARRGVRLPRGSAVDFGCGPGRLSAALATAGFDRVVGVDVSQTMLAKAREIVADERCEFVLNEGADLSFVPSASVDLVYSCRVLQHMPTTLSHGYIREFLRIAAPGGIVAFQIPAEPAGSIGTAMNVVPASVLNRLRKGMEMHGTLPDAVTRLVAEAGGVTLSIEQDTSAGPRWRSHLYVVQVRS